MDTSRVSRRLAVFVLTIGWAFRLTAAGEPPAEAVPPVEQLVSPASAETKLRTGEPADVLLEVREHLGPSILEGTLFQNGQPCAYAWLLGPDHPDAPSDRSAFIDHIRALAAEKPVTCSPASHDECTSPAAGGCGVSWTTTSNAACASCAHQAILCTNQAQVQTAAAVSGLRGAARQLEVVAGEIEDHAQGTPLEAIELAWKQADELREIAATLREKANSTFDESGPHSEQAVLSHVSGGTCSAGQCCSAGAAETKAIVHSNPCSADADCQAGPAATACAEHDRVELSIISKLPHFKALFKNLGVAPCEATPPRTFGVPIAPGSRLFTAVHVAPPHFSTSPAPTAAELEATIDHLAEELNELRAQLRLQTSRRVAADQAPE